MNMSTMLSVTARHALEAMAVLAGLPDGGYLLGKELARQAGIPANYLSKILWLLGSAGFINAARGNGGGYRLQRPASEICLADIVDVFERHRNPSSRCGGPAIRPTHGDACPALHEIDEALNRFLETTTVADIAKTPRANRGTCS
jgi:Rrf2 family iron-sulfur cluster assembly transcriptional regulator